MKLRNNTILPRTLHSSGARCERYALLTVLAGSLAAGGSIASAQEGAKRAQAAPAAPTGQTLTRTVDSGSESVVARSTFWNSECNPRPVTVTIKQQPANGNASVREGLNTVPENPRFGTAGSCVGKQIMGKQIVYRSKADFRGTDVVVYESASDKGERSLITVTIEVR